MKGGLISSPNLSLGSIFDPPPFWKGSQGREKEKRVQGLQIGKQYVQSITGEEKGCCRKLQSSVPDRDIPSSPHQTISAD